MFWKNFKKGGGYCIIKGSVLEVMLAVRSARDVCRMEKGAKETFGKDGKKKKKLYIEDNDVQGCVCDAGVVLKGENRPGFGSGWVGIETSDYFPTSECKRQYSGTLGTLIIS